VKFIFARRLSTKIIWCVSCTVVVLTCFVICGVCMCGCVYVLVL
jgi:hypothetical protein